MRPLIPSKLNAFRAPRLWALWCLVPIASAALAQTPPLQPDYFKESLNPEVNVSGATRGGVLIEALEEPKSLETLTVRLPPQATDNQLCLTMVTRDGRYQGSMEFTVPAKTEDFIELSYPSRFKQELLSANEPYLAVLAGLRPDCETDDNAYIPTAWERPETLSKLQLIINAGNLDAHIIVPTRDGGQRRFECERISSSPTIAFNRICTIELAKDLDLMGTEIRRDDFFGNPLPPVTFPIAF